MYTYPFATQMAVDETLVLSGVTLCEFATDEDMSVCFASMKEENVDTKEAYQVLEIIGSIRNPVWMDYMCTRCRFYRGKLDK